MSHPSVVRRFPCLTVAAALTLLVPSAGAWAAPKSQPITLDSSVTIVESADEPGPVRRATDDLLSDFTKCLARDRRSPTSWRIRVRLRF